MNRRFSRRTMLRGMLKGFTVTLGLPILDMFLNDSGTAYAATEGGGPLPVRFGTWFWGCGMVPNRWEPFKTGDNYDLPPELLPIKAVQQWVTVLSGFGVKLDEKGNIPHYSGNTATRTGSVADSWDTITAPTVDVLIADAIGAGSLYRSLDLSADGNPRTSYSYRSNNSQNPSLSSPLELYSKVFGGNFQDPNSGEFTPDPEIMVRNSVLSSVAEQRKALWAKAGAADRQRLDEFYTSVREIEQQLALRMQKPPPAVACKVPAAPVAIAGDSTDVEVRKANHRLMAQMLAMALACNQTRIFNMTFSNATSDLRQAGRTTGHHQSTHEEMVDPKLGYQPTTDFFATQSMEAWAEFVSTLAQIKEGAGSLLDNTLVWAHSDVSYPKNHDVAGIPQMLAGSAGGRVRQGIHINGGGEPISRVGLTLQQVFGISVAEWGTKSMQASRPISELIT